MRGGDPGRPVSSTSLASLLRQTFPSRQYLHSVTSEGLRPDRPEPEVGIEVDSIVDPSGPCAGRVLTDLPHELEGFEPSDRLANLMVARYPGAILTPWLEAPQPRL
jgi:hypothetical protein